MNSANCGASGHVTSRLRGAQCGASQRLVSSSKTAARRGSLRGEELVHVVDEPHVRCNSTCADKGLRVLAHFALIDGLINRQSKPWLRWTSGYWNAYDGIGNRCRHPAFECRGDDPSIVGRPAEGMVGDPSK